MKAHLIEIVWHREHEGKFNVPIMSLDMHPHKLMLATAGQDKTVKLWQLVQHDGKWGATAICELDYHERSVNCVRWSPCGSKLASCGDDKTILIYSPRGEHTWETARAKRDVQVVRLSNQSDATDLAWSPDCQRVAVGGVDASVSIWDTSKRSMMFVRKDHRSFVQGVAWDPADHLIASESSDRSMALTRVAPVFGRPDAAGKRRRRKNAATIAPQRECPVIRTVSAPDGLSESAEANETDAPATDAAESSSSCSTSASAAATAARKARRAARSLWLPESTPTFFRRPAFSPDGSLLVCPTGQARLLPASASAPASIVPPGPAVEGVVSPVTHVFLRGAWTAPALHLPHKARASVAVAFAPRLFRNERTPQASGAVPDVTSGAEAGVAAGIAPAAVAPRGFALPYSMIFAVATLDGVTVYDTASGEAIAAAANIHMERITDVSWSHDARLVAAASMDGYVSLLAFEPAELGEPLEDAELPASLRPTLPQTADKPEAPASSTSAADAEPSAVTVLQPRKRAVLAPVEDAEPSAVTVLQPRKRAELAPVADAEPSAVTVLQPRKRGTGEVAEAAASKRSHGASAGSDGASAGSVLQAGAGATNAGGGGGSSGSSSDGRKRAMIVQLE